MWINWESHYSNRSNAISRRTTFLWWRWSVYLGRSWPIYLRREHALRAPSSYKLNIKEIKGQFKNNSINYGLCIYTCRSRDCGTRTRKLTDIRVCGTTCYVVNFMVRPSCLKNRPPRPTSKHYVDCFIYCGTELWFLFWPIGLSGVKIG